MIRDRKHDGELFRAVGKLKVTQLRKDCLLLSLSEICHVAVRLREAFKINRIQGETCGLLIFSDPLGFKSTEIIMA